MRFKINDYEVAEYKKWLTQHDKECPLLLNNIHGTIGGRISFIFTPTSLGVAFTVKCACGASKECTDVNDW